MAQYSKILVQLTSRYKDPLDKERGRPKFKTGSYL